MNNILIVFDRYFNTHLYSGYMKMKVFLYGLINGKKYNEVNLNNA